MKKCEKCNVDVRGVHTVCPLCQSKLKGEDDRRVFPRVLTLYKQFALLFKIMLMGTVVATAASVAVNVLIPQSGTWSKFVVFGVVCFWITVAVALHKINNIPQSITSQTVVICVLTVLWDLLTVWHGWSIDYAIPITCTAAIVAMFVLSLVLKWEASDYIMFMFTDVFFGMITLVFYLIGLVHVAIPTVCCIAVSAVALIWMIIFEGKRMREEFTKRFHL